jgi:hypothetical protein
VWSAISAWGGARSRSDLGLGGARSRPRWSAEVGLGLCGDYFCDFLCGNCGVGFVCGVIYCVDLGLCGFDMVAGVGVVVVIVWDGGCCGGDCVGDGCEKK